MELYLDAVSDDDIDYSEYYNSLPIQKKYYHDNLIFYKQSVKDIVVPKLQKIVENKYPYNKYIKIIEYKNCTNYILNLIKNHMINNYPTLLFVIGIKRKLFNTFICIKFRHPIKYLKKFSPKFNKLLFKAIKKDEKILWIKKDIDLRNEICAETNVRNYNLIFKDTGFVFDYKAHRYWCNNYEAIITKYCISVHLSE
ncbi:hypothetical protein QJ854_gp538 [Moumouvirus goulette]|uniref:Uncharacterized protein n=1 Tax=Moumouvirus goulette TaxID=1247379 RepID=M1PBE9_9VIRU|nr:hypothetical protein QJ854_gp538 [Moumouvirus goulette]AGF85244.1 hypothetical protein glt_00435 [Moumouvirus goulette]